MKQAKLTCVAALLAATCLLFTGCMGLGDFVFGLADMLGGSGASQSVVPSSVAASSAAPQGSAAPAPTPTPQPAAGEAAPEALLSLNGEVTAFIGRSNKEVRAANGEVCSCYIMYGGSPVADYMGRDVPYQYAFWLVATQEEMMDVWAEKSDGAGNAPDGENIWPDSFGVGIVEAWGDSIPALFNTERPVTYAMLEQAYGQAPELYFTAANEGVNYSYTIDTWEADYQIEGFHLYAVFSEENGEKELFLLRLQR